MMSVHDMTEPPDVLDAKLASPEKEAVRDLVPAVMGWVAVAAGRVMTQLAARR